MYKYTYNVITLISSPEIATASVSSLFFFSVQWLQWPSKYFLMFIADHRGSIDFGHKVFSPMACYGECFFVSEGPKLGSNLDKLGTMFKNICSYVHIGSNQQSHDVIYKFRIEVCYTYLCWKKSQASHLKWMIGVYHLKKRRFSGGENGGKTFPLMKRRPWSLTSNVLWISGAVLANEGGVERVLEMPWDMVRHGLIGGLEHESHWECHPKSNLVGGLEHFFYFTIYWECHHPNWRTHIFQRGWHHQPVVFQRLLWCLLFVGSELWARTYDLQTLQTVWEKKNDCHLKKGWTGWLTRICSWSFCRSTSTNDWNFPEGQSHRMIWCQGISPKFQNPQNRKEHLPNIDWSIWWKSQFTIYSNYPYSHIDW